LDKRCFKLVVTKLAVYYQKLNQALRSPLHANSIYLMLNSAVSAISGLIFWVAATRLYPAENVGLGSALISAATLLAFATSLGLGYGLIRFLPHAGEKRRDLINSAFSLIGLASLIAGIVFIIGLPLWSPAFLVMRSNLLFGTAFIVAIVAWGLYSIMTNIFAGFRRAEFALANGVIYNLLRVAGVITLALTWEATGIFASWEVATLITLVISIFWFLPRVLPGYRPGITIQKQTTRQIARFSFANYIANGLWHAPQLILPVMVINTLGATSNAYFYIAWTMANTLLAIPLATSTSLFAEGAHQIAHISRDFTRSLKLTAVLLLPAIAIILVIGEQLLLLFGSEYSASGTGLLWLIVPATLPASLNLLYLGTARVLKRLKDIVLVTMLIAVGTLGLSCLLLPRLGTPGAGIAWLVSQTLVALMLLPKIRNIIREKALVYDKSWENLELPA